DGVSAAELKRAKAQLLASEVYKLDSMFGQAMEIGQIESVGLPYRQLDRLREKLQAVSAAEVQAAASKYFDDDALTVGVLDPQPLDGKPRRPAIPTRH
ncbi:MAG: insulinase family protein, partial [Betaproteobacteria bacterium]|nr:insulinase family protein [Betaproteobacteria bacterium]